MKKMVIAVIISLIISSLVYAKEFSDVSTDHWAYGYINYLTENGIASGYPDGSFKPNDTITRAEFFKLMSIVQAEDEASTSYGKAIVNWYDPYVDYIYREGMEMEGTSLEDDVNVPITRKEAMVVMASFAATNRLVDNYDFEQHKECELFNDLDDFSETEQYLLNYVVYCQIINGYEDGTFRPNNSITRAEAATLLCRFTGSWIYSYSERLRLEEN